MPLWLFLEYSSLPRIILPRVLRAASCVSFCSVAVSFDLETFGLFFVEEAFPFLLFPCLSVGARAGAFVNITFTITFDLNVGIVFTPFIVASDHTLCFIFLTGTRTFSLTARLVFRSVL